jgi:hypothetical protein
MSLYKLLAENSLIILDLVGMLQRIFVKFLRVTEVTMKMTNVKIRLFQLLLDNRSFSKGPEKHLEFFLVVLVNSSVTLDGLKLVSADDEFATQKCYFRLGGVFKFCCVGSVSERALGTAS